MMMKMMIDCFTKWLSEPLSEAINIANTETPHTGFYPLENLSSLTDNLK